MHERKPVILKSNFGPLCHWGAHFCCVREESVAQDAGVMFSLVFLFPLVGHPSSQNCPCDCSHALSPMQKKTPIGCFQEEISAHSANGHTGALPKLLLIAKGDATRTSTCPIAKPKDVPCITQQPAPGKRCCPVPVHRQRQAPVPRWAGTRRGIGRDTHPLTEADVYQRKSGDRIYSMMSPRYWKSCQQCGAYYCLPPGLAGCGNEGTNWEK